MIRLWGALVSKQAMKLHTTGAALTLLATVYGSTQAQTPTQQIEAVADTVESLTNNINAFGGVLVVVIILVALLFAFMWRSANQARDARADRLALEERLTLKTAQLIDMTREFTGVAKGAVITHNNANQLGKQFVAQLEADRKSHAAHVDRLIQASDDRYQKFHDEIRTFKEDHLASIEQFGSRITSELSTGLSAMGKEFAQKHKEAVVLVAREQAAMQQNIVNATVAALHEMKLLQPAAVEPIKQTGQPADITISTENVTVNQNEPKGITDAQAIDIYPPIDPHPTAHAADAGPDAAAGADPRADAGDSAQ